jgi:hypothetical protein
VRITYCVRKEDDRGKK